jgi:hypothetical protein
MAIEPMEHRGSKLGFMGFFNISIKFLIERVPSCRIFEFWDFGRIMAIEPMEHKGSKLGFMGFFNISIKFLIERVPSCRIFEFWDFGRIGSRPQAQYP